MIRGTIPRGQAVVLGFICVVLLLGFYSFLSHRQHVKNPDDTTIPSWSQLREGAQTAVEPNKRSGERWLVEDSTATLSRLFLGLGVGIAGSIVLGILMGCFPRIEAFFVPPISFLAKVPPIATLAIFFVMVGTGTNMYVAMIAFGVLPTLAQSIYLAVDELPTELLHKGYTLGASHTEMIWNVIVPFILPRIIDAVRLQIGPAVVYLVAAEMVVGDVGFGYRIRLQSRLLNMNVVYPYIVMLAGFGFGMDYTLRWMRTLCCPWYSARSGD